MHRVDVAAMVRSQAGCPNNVKPEGSIRVAEGLSAAEVGNEIAEHHEHTADHARRDRWIAIFEAVLLSVVALLAAWSGYSAAKWGTESSLSLAHASATRTKASLAEIQDPDPHARLGVVQRRGNCLHGKTPSSSTSSQRLRPGYRPAFEAWLALHPLKNPNAPPDPSYLPQYRSPQQAQGLALNAKADAYFSEGQSAAATADKYVRLTVFLAAVLFLVGIGSRFPARVARYGLVGVAAVLLIVSVVQLLGLPGPPS